MASSENLGNQIMSNQKHIVNAPLVASESEARMVVTIHTDNRPVRRNYPYAMINSSV
jgi:hypothetical protein